MSVEDTKPEDIIKAIEKNFRENIKPWWDEIEKCCIYNNGRGGKIYHLPKVEQSCTIDKRGD